MNYEMKLANRNNKDDEYLNNLYNAYKITPKVIQNVPCVALTQNNEFNNMLRITHMKLLEKAMLRTDGHKYDEMGILMELIEPYDYKIFSGMVNKTTGISSVDPTDVRFLSYLAQHSDNQLLFMHNHPNNSCFSYGDLYNLIMTDEIKVVTAVGNSHGIYSMWKQSGFDKSRASQYLNSVLRRKSSVNVKSSIDKIKHDVATEVIKNASKIDIGYRYTESRNYGGGM